MSEEETKGCDCDPIEECGICKEPAEVVELKQDNKISELQKWVRELVFPGKVENFVQNTKGHNSPGGEHFYEICFFTENHRYRIIAIDRKGNGKDYLGCGVLSRKRRAGETWDRGNDLPDGDLTKETWNTIIRAIVCYELAPLSKFKKPESIPEDVA